MYLPSRLLSWGDKPGDVQTRTAINPKSLLAGVLKQFPVETLCYTYKEKCLFPSNPKTWTPWQASCQRSAIINTLEQCEVCQCQHFITYIAMSMPERGPLACSLITMKHNLPTHAQLVIRLGGVRAGCHLVSVHYRREAKCTRLKNQMEVWFCSHQSVLRCCPSFPAEIPGVLCVWVWLALIKHILEKEVECSLHACASSHTLLLC